MPLGRLVGPLDWRRAAGELVLIVLGVSIALAASAWYEGRAERAEEQMVLRQLQRSLQVDRDAFSRGLELERQIAEGVRALLVHLGSDSPSASDVSSSMPSVRRWVGVFSNGAPYEALKSRGLQLISDEGLRLDLIYYYENRVPILTEAYLNDREFVQSVAAPYIDGHFRQVESGTWIPVDLPSFAHDTRFWNIAMDKLRRVEDRIIPNYEEALGMIQSLLDSIELQLDT